MIRSNEEFDKMAREDEKRFDDEEQLDELMNDLSGEVLHEEELISERTSATVEAYDDDYEDLGEDVFDDEYDEDFVDDLDDWSETDETLFEDDRW